MAIAMILVCADAQGDLRISSTAGCPDATVVRARIDALAKERGAASPLDGDLALEHPTRYRARIRLGDSAERIIDGDDCASLADAAALVVVMSMHANEPEPPAPEPPPPSSPPPSSPSPPPPAPSPPSKPALFVRAALLGEVATGVLPSTALGARGLVGVGVGPIGIQFDGAVFATQTETSPAGLSGDFGLAMLGVRPCGHFAFDAFEITPCAGMSALRFSAAGRGTSADRDEASWALAPSASLGGAWFFTRVVGVRVTFEGGVLLGRPRFVIENDGPLHRPAALVGGLQIGPEMRF